MALSGHTRASIAIFDNDGTLVPSHEVANPAIQEAFAQFRAERSLDAPVPSDARLRELTGQPGELFYRGLLPEPWRHLSEELRSLCLDHEVVGMRERARFYPGIETMLIKLRESGVKLAVATHGGKRYIEAVADRLRYADLFDRVFYHHFDGMTSKGEMARRALRELGPGGGLFIGDRRADREAAQECSIPFVGCLYGYGADGELDGSDFLVTSSEELQSLLLAQCS